jgi:hypothetical protein
MPLDMYAGIYVRDYEVAKSWYAQLLGSEPSFIASLSLSGSLSGFWPPTNAGPRSPAALSRSIRPCAWSGGRSS